MLSNPLFVGEVPLTVSHILRRSAPPRQDSKVPFPAEVVFTSARNDHRLDATVDATADSLNNGKLRAVCHTSLNWQDAVSGGGPEILT